MAVLRIHNIRVFTLSLL